MPEHETLSNGVRVTNADIYRLLLTVEKDLGSVQHTVTNVLKPGLDSAMARIDALDRIKAEKETVLETRGRVEKVEMRVYAMMAGLVAAAIGAKGLGLF